VALEGKDLRDRPLEERKSRLEKLLARSKGGLVYSEHADTSGEKIFVAACEMGLEGIVSKRRDRP
jgi:bifunctional non-homologous end joining protein LigD